MRCAILPTEELSKSQPVQWTLISSVWRSKLASTGRANFVRLEVADSGPGIAPEIRDHIFERFAQYGTNGYAPGSAGLGLAIVKDIVEAHGGRIFIESNHGHGSRFVV